MAITSKDQTFNPEVLTDTIQGVLAHRNALKGSLFVASGAAVSEPSLERGPDSVGEQITIPYFGHIGEFEENLADGAAATPRQLLMKSETAPVTRDSLSFEMTRWAQFAASADPFAEASQQILNSFTRATDKRCLDAAISTGALVADETGNTMTWDIAVNAKARFRDEQDDIVAMIVHSQTKRDMLLLKDSQGRPLLVESQREGEFDRFAGVPVGMSDKVDLTGSVMGAVTEAGTTPPDVTLAGQPLNAYDLKIEITTGGLSNGTAQFRFSTDDGATFSDPLEVPSGGGAFVLDVSITGSNPQADALVGKNGETGITATFTNGTYNVDNVYRAQADLTVSSLLLKRNSIAWWWNRSAMEMLTDKDILRDTDLAAMHLYGAAHRYRRRPGGTMTGVVSIKHDVTVYDGTLDN